MSDLCRRFLLLPSSSVQRKVINAVVMVDRSTARSRGFGFVTMGSTEAAQIILSTPQWFWHLSGGDFEGICVTCWFPRRATATPPADFSVNTGQDIVSANPQADLRVRIFSYIEIYIFHDEIKD
eukprot:g77816.t1